jgi:glycosyltransferase 2 family protein
VTARILVVAALGLALAFYIVTQAGLDAVLTAAGNVGWRGFAILCLYALALFLPLGAAWYVLMPDAPLRKAKVFIWARMVRDAAAEVLPFSQIGGMALGARAAMLHGVTGSTTVGSMIVDVTTELIAQIAYIILGVLILSVHLSQTEHVHARSLTEVMVSGVVLISIGGTLFVLLQRYGHHWIARKLAPRVFPGAMSTTTAVAAVLDEIYRSRARIGVSLALHFCGWVSSAVGTWIAFRLMGADVELAPVIAIESLVYATRSAAFVIPNALGVQEAAYAVLAPLFGIHREVGLALSVLKRARDIAVGIPILLGWQLLEGQRALAGKPTRDH